MKLKALLSALAGTLLLSGDLVAATHTWTGAVSSLWSNNANWMGGTPAGDPNADVVFPNVANKVSTNDMGVVFLRSITFEAGGYVVAGTAGSTIAVSESISWSPASGTNTISLPIQILTSLSVSIPNSQAGATLVLSGAISGGELFITAHNLPTVILTGDNTNSSTLGVSTVHLIVTGSQPLTSFTVNGDFTGSLEGVGTIGPLSLRFANLSPGLDGPGVLTAQGDSILGSWARLKIQLNGPTVGTGYDRVVFGGSVFLQQRMGLSTHGVFLDVSAPYVAAIGEVFTILTATGTLSGILENIPDGTVLSFSCQNFRVNYTPNSITLTRVAGGGPPLSSVEISVEGAQNVCTNSSGGTATVTDVGGCTTMHQWGFRTVSGGAITPIPGATATTYVIDGSDFPGVGSYYLVETTTPQFGSPMTSNERTVTVAPAPTAVATGSATIICGDSTTLSGSGAANCSWSPAGGLSDPNSCNPVATPNSTTTYSLTVSGASGCTSTNNAPVTVTVDPACPSSGSAFYTIPACRMVDTREPDVPLIGGSQTVFAVVGNCGIPDGAKAIALNVTVVKPESDGYLTLYAAGIARPVTSTINYRSGQVRANNATVALNAGGGITVFCGGDGDTDVILDVIGYYK